MTQRITEPSGCATDYHGRVLRRLLGPDRPAERPPAALARGGPSATVAGEYLPQSLAAKMARWSPWARALSERLWSVGFQESSASRYRSLCWRLVL